MFGVMGVQHLQLLDEILRNTTIGIGELQQLSISNLTQLERNIPKQWPCSKENPAFR